MSTTKVTSNVIADDAVTQAKIADDAVGADQLASSAVVTASIVDLNVTTAKIAADAITGAKIADDTINSEHYASESIDTEHIADLNVTTAKIANDAITTAKIADDVELGGNPTTTTQSSGNNTTRIATTAFVTAAVAASSGSSAADDISTGDAAVTIGTSSGDITLDSPADIILDADGGDINLKDGGTQFGNIGKGGGSDLIITASIADKDIFFTGTDGSSAITALTLDMSDAGTAIFNHDIVLGDDDVIKMGDTNEDFEIYHIGGSVNVIRGTNAMVLQSDDYISLGTHSGGELMLKATKNGAVDIYHDNVIQASTTTAGLSLPTTPMFGVARNAGYLSDDQVWVCDHADTNVGSHYDTSNGKFTAPVAGVYFFTGSVMTHDSSNNVAQVSWSFRKNNSSVKDFISHKINAVHHRVDGSLVITLAANDFVTLFVNDSNTSSGWAGSQAIQNHFGGFLIG